MIRRIVKMEFRAGAAEQFEALFRSTAPHIRAQEGCQHLELLREEGGSSVYFTFSIWQDQAALQAYRQSELFARTWKKTKALFADKPMAWSTQQLELHP